MAFGVWCLGVFLVATVAGVFFFFFFLGGGSLVMVLIGLYIVLLSTLFSSPRLKVFVQRSSFAPFKLFAFVRAAIWQKSPFKQD